MISWWSDHVKMMDLWQPLEWSGLGPRLWWHPQLELQALMGQECRVEVVVEVRNAAESDEGQQYAGPTEHILICLIQSGLLIKNIYKSYDLILAQQSYYSIAALGSNSGMGFHSTSDINSKLNWCLFVSRLALKENIIFE